MKPSELRTIYTEATAARHASPSEVELRTWKPLQMLDGEDVRAALAEWSKDSTPTATGRPRGSFMPRCEDLKPLADRAASSRRQRNSTPEVCIGLRCEVCRRTITKFIRQGEPETRVCCGRSMQLIYRGAA